MTVRMKQATCLAHKQYADVDERLVDILALHLHPEFGSRYWLAEQDRLGIDVRDRIRHIDDLVELGIRTPKMIGSLSVWDLIPQALHRDRCQFIVGETGGTTGLPTATAYLRDEFIEAFVDPFVAVANAIGFPQQAHWLFVGPSGPHIIGKAAREVVLRMKSPDPWTVDFDPRWAKKLVKDSLAAKRYMGHVVEQSLAVFQREPVGVLFSTPPVLRRLAEVLSDRQRLAIQGVHYGGTAITADELNKLRDLFPEAVHLAGYGNTLFGCALETHDNRRSNIDYFPSSNRLLFDVVQSPATVASPEPNRGQLMFHRLDQSMFLPNMLERDWAERIDSPEPKNRLGWQPIGIRNPGPPPDSTGSLKIGIY